jgi:drug/metabolite transporter (DMT)-like permease
MIFLIGSIILTTYLTLSFKVLQKLNIDVFPAIVFNYLTCVVTGSLVNGNIPFSQQVTTADWFKWALVMGSLFIILFNLIAFVTQKIGVAVSSVANKLSMIIPVLFFIVFNNDPYNLLKIIGIVVAIIAVVCTCYTTSNNSQLKNKNLLYILPLILFVGSGLLDTLYKDVYDKYLNNNDTALNNFLITSFATAGIVGFTILMYQYVTKKRIFSIKTVLAGICIGLPNYFSIWCLGKVYKENLMESSAIIPVNNMAIVFVSTLAAFIFFKEKLSKINWMGILLSIAAIALIAFSGA